MQIYWLEQTLADVPVSNAWLSDDEFLRLSSLRFLKRRTDWRLGRWTAKCALSSYLDLPSSHDELARIEVRAASSGAPEVFLDNNPAQVTISLSHRAGRALCAVMPPGVKLGCDLELVEPGGATSLADYFTEEERNLLNRVPAEDLDRLSMLLWSAKESALKALHEGLRISANHAVVDLSDLSFGFDGWSELQVRHRDSQLFHGWWQRQENFVYTVLADERPDCPIPLSASSVDKTLRCA